MNRAEFMEKLRALLADVEDGEREEALNYYEDILTMPESRMNSK